MPVQCHSFSRGFIATQFNWSALKVSRKKETGAEEKRNRLLQEFSHTSSSSSLSPHCSSTSSQLHRDEAEGGSEPHSTAPLPPHGVDLHLHHLPALLRRQLGLGARRGGLRHRWGASQEGESPLRAGMSRGTLQSGECHQDAGGVAAPGCGHPG